MVVVVVVNVVGVGVLDGERVAAGDADGGFDFEAVFPVSVSFSVSLAGGILDVEGWFVGAAGGGRG